MNANLLSRTNHFFLLVILGAIFPLTSYSQSNKIDRQELIWESSSSDYGRLTGSATVSFEGELFSLIYKRIPLQNGQMVVVQNQQYQTIQSQSKAIKKFVEVPEYSSIQITEEAGKLFASILINPFRVNRSGVIERLVSYELAIVEGEATALELGVRGIFQGDRRGHTWLRWDYEINKRNRIGHGIEHPASDQLTIFVRLKRNPTRNGIDADLPQHFAALDIHRKNQCSSNPKMHSVVPTATVWSRIGNGE